MDLNIFKKISQNLKRVDTTEFLQELKNNIEKSDNSKETVPLLDKIQNKSKLSIGTKNKMENEFDKILLDYANETQDKGDLYFVVERSKKDNLLVVYKYENGVDTVFKLSDSDLPVNAGVNSSLRIEDGKFLLDEDATIEIENRINEMTKELVEEQNKVLEEYRKDGHLYRVSENINNHVFLWDITDKPKEEIEEVDFPEELLDKAIEGTVFVYMDGEYKYTENNENIV